MTTAERIKARRIEIGMTGEDLAKQIGVSKTTVYRYENGDIEKIPLNSLEPIAKALHTTVAYLMGWEEKKEPIPDIEDGRRELIQIYDQLPENFQDKAIECLRILLDLSGTLSPDQAASNSAPKQGG